jgi:hypothetical protein
MQHPDFLTVAVDITRRHVDHLDRLTHWSPSDSPIRRNRQLTACGSWVALGRFPADPTCPACRQEQAIYESLQF